MFQCVFDFFCTANGRLRRMMNLGFPKRKLNPNKSENPLDVGFAKNCRIRQHSYSYSNSITSPINSATVNTQVNRC